ncbi:MAG: multiubiquitin domain-containing protein [Gemmatimonadaceae bacterium]
MTDQKQAGSNEGVQPKHEHAIQIQIDRVHYKVEKKTISGTELRHVPTPPIPADRDLFQVIPGGPDRKIGDADQVELHDGARFFTAPGQINPGLSNAR